MLYPGYVRLSKVLPCMLLVRWIGSPWWRSLGAQCPEIMLHTVGCSLKLLKKRRQADLAGPHAWLHCFCMVLQLQHTCWCTQSWKTEGDPAMMRGRKSTQTWFIALEIAIGAHVWAPLNFIRGRSAKFACRATRK